jgi:hypothetical protein
LSTNGLSRADDRVIYAKAVDHEKVWLSSLSLC